MSILDEVHQKKVSSKRRKWFFLFGWVLLVCFLIWRFLFSTQQEHWIALESHVVSRWEIKTWIEAEWRVSWEDQVVVRFDLNEKLTQIDKEPWDTVHVWEILAYIDDTQVMLNLQKAKNNLAQAKSRYQELVDPLSINEVNVLDKKLELEQKTYKDNILKLEHALKEAEDSLKTLDISQQETLLKLNNTWVTSSSSIKSAKIAYDKNIQSLVREVELLNQSEKTAKLDIQQAMEELDKVRADNDIDLTVSLEEQKSEQYIADVNLTSKDLIRVIWEYLDDVDKFLWISVTHELLNDSYEQLISAQNTWLLTQAKSLWRSLWSWMSSLFLWSSTLEESLRQSEEVLALSEEVREFWTLMVDVLNATVTDEYFTESTRSAYISQFRWWTAQISQYVWQLQQIAQWIRLTESSSATVIDTSDDRQQDMIFILEQRIQKWEKILADISTEKRLKRDEILTTHAAFENELETVQQNDEFLQQEIDISTQRSTAEYTIAQDEIQRLKIELAQAKEVYQTSLELATLDTAQRKDPVSLSQKNTSALQIQAYEIAVREQQLQLEKTILKSPVQWTVLDVDNSVWEFPSATFMSLAMWWSRYIQVRIEEEEVNTITPGQRVELTLDANPDEIYEWRVYYVSPTWERDLNDIVQYNVLITYDDAMNARSEMTVTANFIREHEKNVIVLPLSYILKKEGKDRVQIWESPDMLREVMLWNKDESFVSVLLWVEEWEVVYLPLQEDE